MYKRSAKIEIDSLNPFKGDLLDRVESAENLTELVKSSTGGMVLSLTGAWGSGKTTFVRMWRKHLENQGIKSLYFNAWEHDFAEDPLIAFVSEMKSLIGTKESVKGQGPKTNEYYEKVKGAGVRILKSSLPAVIKGLTGNILDFQGVELGVAMEKAIAEATSKVAEKELERYESEKSALSQFRTELEAFVKSVTIETNNLPLVFFIDELDRCKPPFAIHLLERVKHLLDVQGICFVIAVDRQQLFSSVRSLYGVDIDVEGYLLRFIDLEYSLPYPSVFNFVDCLFKQHGLNELLKRSKNWYQATDLLFSSFTDYTSALGLSLRQIDRCVSRVGIVLRTINKGRRGGLMYFYPEFLVFLTIMRAINYEMYKNILEGKYSWHILVHDLEKSEGRIVQITKIESWLRLKGFFLMLLGTKEERRLFIRSHESLPPEKRKIMPAEEEIYSMNKNAMDHGWSDFNRDFDYLVKKIEFASSFSR